MSIISSLCQWVIPVAAGAAILLMTFFAVAFYFPGDTYADSLGSAYAVIWQHTTQQQFTFIMRDRPWLYVIPAGGLILLSGWQLPRQYYGRAIFAYAVFGIGFVGGHVFW